MPGGRRIGVLGRGGSDLIGVMFGRMRIVARFGLLIRVFGGFRRWLVCEEQTPGAGAGNRTGGCQSKDGQRTEVGIATENFTNS